MMPCDDCRALLLDHLYGLLEPAEAQAVETHLPPCPACSAVCDREAHTKGLFAQAAKREFPYVRFQPPVEDPASNGFKQPLPVGSTTQQAHQPRTTRRVFGAWLGWAVAASVIIGFAA